MVHCEVFLTEKIERKKKTADLIMSRFMSFLQEICIYKHIKALFLKKRSDCKSDKYKA